MKFLVVCFNVWWSVPVQKFGWRKNTGKKKKMTAGVASSGTERWQQWAECGRRTVPNRLRLATCAPSPQRWRTHQAGLLLFLQGQPGTFQTGTTRKKPALGTTGFPPREPLPRCKRWKGSAQGQSVVQGRNAGWPHTSRLSRGSARPEPTVVDTMLPGAPLQFGTMSVRLGTTDTVRVAQRRRPCVWEPLRSIISNAVLISLNNYVFFKFHSYAWMKSKGVCTENEVYISLHQYNHTFCDTKSA